MSKTIIYPLKRIIMKKLFILPLLLASFIVTACVKDDSIVKPGESLDDLNYLAVLLTQRSDEEILQAAQDQDLRISFVSQYYVAAQNRRPHVLVMNYSGLEEEKVEEAVSRLCRAVLG